MLELLSLVITFSPAGLELTYDGFADDPDDPRCNLSLPMIRLT